ncbi:MAG TPA: MmcQ/YjbR family DNA-binding protein [Steroidobacteraceae bacterium]|nr:MmcQ/YjbR family DNA-binding protein [Steroidobacteraceae bacterium]
MKFATIHKFAMSLPETTEAPHHHFSSFRVRGKIFVTIPPDQKFLHLFIPEFEREQALAMYPEFVEKLFWGGKMLGIKVTLADADTATVKMLVRQAWEYKAPKALQEKPRKPTK